MTTKMLQGFGDYLGKVKDQVRKKYQSEMKRLMPSKAVEFLVPDGKTKCVSAHTQLV